MDLVHPAEARHHARAAVQVPEAARLGGAHLDARREQVLRYPVVAEGALVRRTGVWIEVPRAVGAGLDAVAAPDARLGVDQDDAVLGLERRPHGADLYAGRIGALVAQLRNEEAPQDLPVGRRFGHAFRLRLDGLHDDLAVLPDDVALDPGPEIERHPGDVVLGLARLDAPCAADALVDGNPESVPLPRPGRFLRERARGQDLQHPP